MHDAFHAWDELKSRTFRDMYDEAHRRSPTPVKAPFVSAHFGIMHPDPFRPYFRPYIGSVLKYLVARQPEEKRASDGVVNKWIDQIDIYYDDSRDTNLLEKLVFNFDEDDTGIIWRLEVHREYCSLTLFAPVSEADLTTFQTELREAAPTPEPGHPGPVRPFLDGKLRTLTELKLDFMRQVRADLIRSRDHERHDHPAAYHAPADSSLNIFVDYFGFMLPISALGRSEAGTDIFPAVKSNGFSDPDENKSARFNAANALLSDLLTPAHIRQRFVRHAAPANLVACYVFLGHFLLLSGMGGREETPHPTALGDRSPGIYWLFYNDRHAEDDTSPELVAATNRRASRLIYMLNTIGTARIAALFNMKAMKDFSQKLRTLEAEVLQLRLSDEKRAIELSRDLRKKLARAEDKVGESILYRANRTSYYRGIMNTLIGDLGIETIPSWQGLDKFIRRRLDPSISYLAGLGERYEALNTLIANEWSINMSSKIYDFQRIADYLYPFLLLYYLPHAFENVGHAIADLSELATHADKLQRPDPWGMAVHIAELAARHAAHIGLDLGVAGLLLYGLYRLVFRKRKQ